MATLYEFIFEQQFVRVPQLEPRDLSGQVVAITGANQGLGLEMARQLARMKPAKLIVTSRSAAKMEKPLEQLIHESGNKNIVAWQLDLTSNDSIKAFVDRLNREAGARLDLLLCNAGIQLYNWTTAEGHETTLQTNVYGTYSLALLLHPLMKSTTRDRGSLGPARVVFVSSDTHTWINSAPVDGFLAKLNSEEATKAAVQSKDPRDKSLTMNSRYACSKFVLQQAFTQFAKHLNPDEVVWATANPGLTRTALTREVKGLIITPLKAVAMQILARPVDAGARCILYPALLPNAKDAHGKYYNNSTEYRLSEYVQSEEGKQLASNLYNDLIKELGKVDKRVLQVVQ